ncbi:tetratricopeptide repeat protein [Photobacterium kasasachensis]|uniref:tetratricopeptide repeat protein n=1 Tax=Photobacterium kasasachensis TaxID=2910240 RepID=UPI003D10D02F
MQDGNNLLDNEELLALSRNALEREDYHDALIKIKYILKRNEVPAGVYALLGRTYAALELHDKAVAAFNEFLHHRPEVIPERFHLGVVYREMGDNAKALAVWEEVLEKAPNFPPALYNKALFLLDDGNEDEAIELFNYIIENVEPDDSHVEMANHMLSTISLAS